MQFFILLKMQKVKDAHCTKLLFETFYLLFNLNFLNFKFFTLFYQRCVFSSNSNYKLSIHASYNSYISGLYVIKSTHIIFLQFRDVATQLYLTSTTISSYLHGIMGDYFMGTWSNGRPKPFK